MDNPPLASLSLSHVQYNPSDPLSHLCAWLALIPQTLCTTYIVLLWATREVEVGLMFAGQMGCEALNFGLKRLLREERPREMLGKGYGMPSSHAQFLSFFAVYISLWLLVRHNPPSHYSRPPNSPTSSTSSTSTSSSKLSTSDIVFPLSNPAIHALTAALCVTVAAAVAASRVYLNYHTPKQVLVGCAAGAVAAVVWFAVTALMRRWGVIEWGLEWKVCRMVRLRDLCVEEDIFEVGWREWDRRKGERVKGKKS